MTDTERLRLKTLAFDLAWFRQWLKDHKVHIGERSPIAEVERYVRQTASEDKP